MQNPDRGFRGAFIFRTVCSHKVQNETHKIPTSSGVIDAEWICEKKRNWDIEH